VDRFDGRADAGSRRQVQEDRAVPILLEFELNPRIEAVDVDSGHPGGQPLLAVKETPLVKQVEP
jgi:hypothetical protein